MAEFVSAVIGITAVALQSSNLLVELTTKTKNAPKEIVALKNDVSNVAKILFSLDASLNSSRIRESVKTDSEIVRAVSNLKKPLEDCSETYDGLVKKLRGYMKPVDESKNEYTISASNRFL